MNISKSEIYMGDVISEAGTLDEKIRLRKLKVIHTYLKLELYCLICLLGTEGSK